MKLFLVLFCALIGFQSCSQKRIEISIYESSEYVYCDVWVKNDGRIINSLSNGYFHKSYMTVEQVKQEATKDAKEWIAGKYKGYKITYKHKGSGENEYQRKLLRENKAEPEKAGRN